MNQKCRDPCSGACGLQTECQVHLHAAVCSCKEGYTGDPFQNCHRRENIGMFNSIKTHDEIKFFVSE